MKQEDVDRARAEREFRKNPPATEAGQGDGDEDEGWGDLFDNIDSSGGGLGLDTDSSADLEALLGGNSVTGNTTNNQQIGTSTNTQNGVSQYEKMAIDVAIASGKGLKVFCSELIESFKDNKSSDWVKLGGNTITISGWTLGVGAVFQIFELFIKGLSNSWVILVGGLLSMGVGITLVCFNIDNAKKELENSEENSKSSEGSPSDNSDFEDDWEDLYNKSEESSSSDWDSLDNNDNNDNGWESSSFEDAWDSLDYDDDAYVEVTDPVSVDNAIESMPDIPKGTYTRQFLYETFCKVLPTYSPNFSEMQDVSDETDEFIELELKLRDSCSQTGTPDDKLPDLVEMRKNAFMVQLVATRPSGLKEDAIAKELAILYSRDKYGKIIREGVYSSVNSVGKSLIINIFTGTTMMVSLGDLYKKFKTDILDLKNVMPMFWGVDENGDAKFSDFNNVENIIISGPGRSGKSWKGQSLISQICMFNSPKDVEFHIHDVKGFDSDYRKPYELLPHIRKFYYKPQDIINSLNNITTKERARRKKILKENDCISIKDLHAKGIELSYYFIVIDEIAGLTKDFDKDQYKDFQGKLIKIVTEMSNIGFRLILFPHRLVNEIISKSVYNLIRTKLFVRAEFTDIKNATSVNTVKEFPYLLSNRGDMALTTDDVARGRVIFVHGEVITDNNNSNFDIFKYIGSVWNKLEPEYNVPKLCLNEDDIGVDKSFSSSNYIFDSAKIKERESLESEFEQMIKESEEFEYEGDDYEEEAIEKAKKSVQSNKKVEKKSEPKVKKEVEDDGWGDDSDAFDNLWNSIDSEVSSAKKGKELEDAFDFDDDGFGTFLGD